MERSYIKKAYDNFETPTKEFLQKTVVPAVLLGLTISLSAIVLAPDVLKNPFIYFLVVLTPLYFLLGTLLWPLAEFQSRKMEIDRELLLFMVRMGVLSEAEMPKKDMFNILEGQKEFGVLGVEINKIYKLVATWNTNLGDACRILSTRTPSTLFADFLDRLAHAIDSGDDPRAFFKREQRAFKNNYDVEYRGMLFKLEILMELFIAIIIIATFFEFFVVILPFLNYTDGTPYFIAVPFLFIFLELLYVFFLQATMPKETLRQQSKILSPYEKTLAKLLALSVVLCGLCFLALFFFAADWLEDDTFMPIFVALGFTPLFIPGISAQLYDKKVQRTEDNFPAFIRSLGGSAAAGGTGMLQALEKLTNHDFGPLTEHIRSLYKRINLNINSEQAWEHFGAETGSDLISKFSKMYMGGVKAGGSHERISEILSDNFLNIVGLRKHRYIYASIFTMVIYGVALVVSFSLFISGDVTKEVADRYSEFEIPNAIAGAGIVAPDVFDPFQVTFAFFIIIFSHAIVSGLIVKVVGASSYTGSFVHIPGILWVGALMSLFSEFVIARIL